MIRSYVLEVLILGRHINDGIRTFMVTKHNNPICVHGNSKGDGSDEYLQPAAIAVDHHKNLVTILHIYIECNVGEWKKNGADKIFIKKLLFAGVRRWYG